MPLTAPTFQDLFNTGRAEAVDRRPDLTFDEGDISEMDVSAGAAMADHVVGYSLQRARNLFLDSSAGDALTTLADDRYGLQRIAASQATGVITFERNSTLGALAGVLSAGTVVATEKDSSGSEVQYMLLDDLGFNLGELVKTAPVIALLAGRAGNANVDTVIRVISTGLFDNFTCFNLDRMAGGDEEEEDEHLRQRCRDFTQTLRRGTLAALEYGAKLVPGVSVASAIEPGDGTVNLYISDAGGNSSILMISAVVAELVNWRCGGTIVNVWGGSLFTLIGGINISLTTRVGVSSAAIASDIKKAIVARVAKLKLGEKLSPTLIKNAAATVDPDGITEILVNAPVGTVDPGPSGLIRVTAPEISVA